MSRTICACVAVLMSLATPAFAGTTLPSLGAKPTEISVSGISSGAYMAGQFQLAHSGVVSGAAIIAGGPYGCAVSSYAGFMLGPVRSAANLSKAVNGCMLNLYSIWGIPDVNHLVRQAQRLARDGEIDPVSGVLDDKVYLFSGKNDRTVRPAIVAAAGEFYEKLGVAPANIKRVSDYPAGHAFVTESEGGACEVSREPYVVDCDYDQAGDVLQHMYGPLSPPSASSEGEFRTFDQSQFLVGLGTHGLDETGVVYLPLTCVREPGCRIHISFHGCGQTSDEVGDAFTRGSGFARWADRNRLIILFPQVRTTAMNEHGCWDWWGYSSDKFLTRAGPQVAAVKRMLDRLAAEPANVP